MTSLLKRYRWWILGAASVLAGFVVVVIALGIWILSLLPSPAETVAWIEASLGAAQNKVPNSQAIQALIQESKAACVNEGSAACAKTLQALRQTASMAGLEIPQLDSIIGPYRELVSTWVDVAKAWVGESTKPQ
jgi:hypothetical protein